MHPHRPAPPGPMTVHVYSFIRQASLDRFACCFVSKLCIFLHHRVQTRTFIACYFCYQSSIQNIHLSHAHTTVYMRAATYYDTIAESFMCVFTAEVRVGGRLNFHCLAKVSSDCVLLSQNYTHTGPCVQRCRNATTPRHEWATLVALRNCQPILVFILATLWDQTLRKQATITVHSLLIIG